MHQDAKEPFVSAVYRAEEDDQNKPPKRIEDIKVDSKKRARNRHAKRHYSAKRTVEVIAAERRRYPDK